MDEGGASLKRSRSEEDSELLIDTRSPKRIVVDTSDPHERDDDYYFEDGDCIILVENVFFKLPRFLLSRGSSAFRDVFPLPAELDRSCESLTEDNPLELDECAEDFRALCWALFAFPDEIIEQSDLCKVDFQRLLSLYYITNKYHFIKHEKWVSDLLTKHCTFKESEEESNLFLKACSIQDLKRLLKLAYECKNAQLTTCTSREWVRRLREDPTMSSKDALDFAESLNMRYLQGRIYYAELLRTKADKRPASMSIHFPENGFNDSQSL